MAQLHITIGQKTRWFCAPAWEQITLGTKTPSEREPKGNDRSKTEAASAVFWPVGCSGMAVFLDSCAVSHFLDVIKLEPPSDFLLS